MRKPVLDLYASHPKFGYGRVENLGQKSVVRFGNERKTIHWIGLRLVSGLSVILGGGEVAKGRRKSTQVDWTWLNPQTVRPLRTSPVVGLVPPVRIIPTPRRRVGYYPRKKRIVQLIDNDRNRDIGFTADTISQGWEGRADLEGRDNSVDVKDNVGRDKSAEADNNIIRIYTFGPDGRREFHGLDGDLADYVPDGEDLRSYGAGKRALLIPTVTRSLNRRERRLLKVLEYREKNIPARRISQLMHLPEPEVKTLLREINRKVPKEPDFARDDNGRFEKCQ